jgi:hypothetical protein
MTGLVEVNSDEAGNCRDSLPDDFLQTPDAAIEPGRGHCPYRRPGFAAMSASSKYLVAGLPLAGLAFALTLLPAAGCRSRTEAGEPEAKARLTKLLRLYRAYADRHGQGPPSDAALREFGQKLSPKDRDELLIGDDLDGIFVSPRDNQKFVIRHDLKLSGGATRAVAWETEGHAGKRFVALSMGYVEEYDEETFQQYRK